MTMAENAHEALSVEGLCAGYGHLQILHSIDLSLRWNSAVTVIGLNGAGKTTLIRAISGAIRPSSGHVRFDGAEVSHMRGSQIARLGIVTVFEGKQLFADLSVRENLFLGYRTMGRRTGEPEDSVMQSIYELLPRLKERSRQVAGTLSGGEQQMLAIGRALACKPRVLILDEPSTGLAPRIADEIFAALDNLRSSQLAMLIIEQDVERALTVADYAYVLTSGTITKEGPTEVFVREMEASDVLFAQ